MSGYLIPCGFAECELVERRSRFIGRIWPVKDESEALEQIRAVRERHWDATHNVYAYSIKENGIMRYSDDGEPQSTAGLPVLDVLRKAQVYDALIVVTRYFGGVLLGAGGLVRAYSAAAASALKAAKTAELRRWEAVELACPYPLYERVKAELERAGGILRDTAYAERVRVEFLLTEERIPPLFERLAELSAGELLPERAGFVMLAQPGGDT